MSHLSSRRHFFKTATALVLAQAAAPVRQSFAIDPFHRPGKPHLSLSLAAYSFRDSFPSRGKKSASGHELDLFGFIDFCAEHECQGTELTSYYFPAETDEALLLKLKRHAFLRGIEISGSAVGNTFTLPEGPKRQEQIQMVKTWIDRAAILGAPHIRIFSGGQEGGISKEEARRRAIAAIEECCDYAGKKGIFLGLENHGGIVAEPEDLLAIVKAVKSPWFGVNLDTGNFHTEDPYAALERCAPYAVNVQVKSEINRRGRGVEKADLARLVKILRDANYQGYVALEYEAKEDPWKAVPEILRELAGLLRA